ncbi:unnamed protein product [Parnassius apollo]|uniref:Hemolin n=1 Tax=Parnassius apollo TaxID=110799 RepID=A0A8S3WAS6_PARAO|nr:unnamed protein product [Parnassius apollo]
MSQSDYVTGEMVLFSKNRRRNGLSIAVDRTGLEAGSRSEAAAATTSLAPALPRPSTTRTNVTTQNIADKLGDEKGLAEHLKLPIQRINDYQLLLKELVKYSKRLGEDCTDLQNALELFLGVPNRATDNKFISSIEGYRGNIYKLGRLLTHDWFTVSVAEKSSERYLFLFKARILICKVKRIENDRSVFILKHIIKLPDVEVKDYSTDKLKFELHQKSPPLIFTLAAHKESIKNNWLKEIRQHSSDVVALAEHAADDLQVLLPEQTASESEYLSPEPEDKKKKRQHTDNTQVEEENPNKEKRSRTEEVQVAEILTREESLAELQAKRKASIESAKSKKAARSETQEVLSTSEAHEVVIADNTKITAELEIQSSFDIQETEICEIQSTTSLSEQSKIKIKETEEERVEFNSNLSSTACISNKQSNVTLIEAEKVAKDSSIASDEIKIVETEGVSSAILKAQIEVQNEEILIVPSEVSREEPKAGIFVQEETSSVSLSKQTKVTLESSSGEQSSQTSYQVFAEQTQAANPICKNNNQHNKEESIDQQLQKATESNTVQSIISSYVEHSDFTTKLKLDTEESISNKISEVSSIEKTKLTAAEQPLITKDKSTFENHAQSTLQTSLQQQTVEAVSTEVLNSQQQVLSSEELYDQKEYISVDERIEQPALTITTVELSEEDKKQTNNSLFSKEKSVSKDHTANEIVENTNDQAAVTESQSKDSKEIKVEELSESGAESREEFVTNSQTVTAQENVEDEMTSRYNSRSSRLSGEYSSSTRKSSSGRYESSTGTSLSSYSRRESGARIESSKYETSGNIEGISSSKYESKYSSAGARIEGGNTYGVESSYESKAEGGSKYALESNYESSNKIDSIASKYGIDTNGKIERRSSKYSMQSSYDGEKIESGDKLESSMEATSKIDSIALKYGRDINGRAEGRSTRLSIDAGYDGENIESGTRIESDYQKSKKGESIYERKYSKTALSNGSVTGEYESTKSVSKSENLDGKPIFSKTLEGQNIEPGENAAFECALLESDDVKVTWLKDNKPLTDRLMDRCSITSIEGSYKLLLMHCREDDAGTYTAIAENVKGNAHCTAQLVVQELTPEERKERNALNAPYFLVALKDTEILQNTYLRFMVRVKGDPNPTVKFYRDGKEIVASSESDRVSIVRTHADKGYYELVISDVNTNDAGTYSCRAMNIYGDVESEAKVTVVDDKNIFGELLPGGEGLLAKGEKPAFTWKRDGQPFDPEERFKVLLGEDEDSLALVFQHVKPEDAGLYTCVAKTSTGNISCSAELTVQGAVYELHREPEKPTLVVEHREAVVAAGGSAVLELQCKGFPKPSVTFKHQGQLVEPDTRHKFLYEDEESMSLVIKNVGPADAGEYQVTASNELGEDTTTMHLVVKAAPKIKKKIENQSCMVGDTHTVTIEVEGTPAPEVSFYKDGVEIKSSERIVIVKESETIYKITIKEAKLTDTGSYSVVAKNEVNQCSDFWQWHVSSAPKIIKKLGSSKVCEEKETVTFKIETESDPAPTVKWFKNKTELTESSAVKISSSGEAHSLVITSAARADAGEYSCEVRNAHGSARDECALHVRCAPQFTRRLQDVTAREGDVDVEFTVDVNAYPEPKVQWYFGDVEITEKKSVYTRVDNGSTHKLILKEVSAELSGQYSCKVSNELGADSCQATFTVNRKPRITKSLVDMTVDAGQTLKLEVEVEGCPEPKVKWYKDGKEVTTDARIKIERDTKRLENYNLTVTLIKEEDGGEYEVRAENEMGSVSSKSTVTIHTKEVHSRFKKETVIENELEGELKEQHVVNVVDEKDKKSATKHNTEPETVEEKPVDDTLKQIEVKEIDLPNAECGKKSLTEPQEIEEKSFWDDVDDGFEIKKPKVDYNETISSKSRKSFSEPEIAEEKSLWDDNRKEQNQNAIVDEINEVPQKGRKSFSEPENSQEESMGDNDKEKVKRVRVEDINREPERSEKSFSQPEALEEKNLWDEINENERIKKVEVNDSTEMPVKPRKSFSEPDSMEEKSIWDDKQGEQIQTPIFKDVETKMDQGKRAVTEPEVIKEIKIDDDLKTSKRKSVKRQSLKEEPLSAETEGRVFETITTFKTGDGGSIIVSKVSSSRSHGAIITGPAETHTLHKMTSKYYDYDDECTKKIILPNKPHTTSLEVEEIASHSYFLTEHGYYTVPDHVRRGTYGIIEEPQTDSDADSIKYGKRTANRTISIHSVSEDENSWQNEPLSREISIEDLSKSIFEIDETHKVFSKDSYVRQSSFTEDYFTNDGEEESIILKEKREKIFENDITEKLIHISKEFDETDIKSVGNKLDEVKNRLIEELVIGHVENLDNVTKDIAETTVERKTKHGAKLFIVEEDEDGEMEALLRRSQRQRSILDDILNQEDAKAPPKLKESSMKDSNVFESLPLVFTVEACGSPKPTVRWLHDGKEVKPDARVHLINEGDLYKLEIDKAEMGDAGKWQCEISNNLGKDVLQAEVTVKPESELRKPIFKVPLEAQRVMQREPVTLKAVCTADPLPHVAWLLNGNELTPDATLLMQADTEDIDHGLKQCTFTLHIPTGRHADTGVYTIQAKNKYGVGESSARLDILLRPEIEGLKDVNAMPYEETTFIAKIQANPIAEVQWSKDGYVIKPSSRFDIEEDKASETHKLVVKKVTVEDAGVYSVTAKNELGEASQQAKLTVHTDKPKFTKPLQKETVKDYDDCTLKVRCDGVPKPEVHWYVNDKEVKNDERHTITTEIGGQVDSELEIKHFNSTDAGKYKVRAVNLSGEAECEAQISLAQTSPGFAHKLERQKDVDEGEPLELKAKLDGSPIPTAKWFKDGAPLPPEDTRVKQTSLPDGTVKLSIEHVTPADCGAYKLVISNPNGENSAMCAVAVNPTPRKPSFSEPLEDVKTVVGQPLKLQARVMAFPAPEVKWFKDGLPVRPSQAINFINQPGGVIGLSIDNCKPEDAGLYSLTVANKLGDVESKAKVEVTQKERKPAFIAELMPIKVIEGFPAKLEVKVLGHPPPLIKWTHNGQEVVPDGNRIRVVTQPDGMFALLISEVQEPDAGQYGVIAANDKGETSCSAELSVASRTDDSCPEERPRFVHGLRETTADEGQALQLSAALAGNPAPDVLWTKDGSPLMPSERLLLSCDGKRVGLEINPVELADAGVYSVKLTNPLGEDSSEAKVNVRKVYQPPTFSQKFTDLQQLPSLDAKFSARVHGKPTPEVSWFKNGQPLSPSDKYGIKRDGEACCLYVRDLKPEDAGSYKCLAKNKEGEATCEATLEVVEKIGRQQRAEPPSFLKRIGDADVVRGMAAKFTACATGSPDPDVEWFRNDEKLFPCERIRMDKETTGLLRLSISGVDQSDVGTYRCRIFNQHGEDSCTAQLTYDTLEPLSSKRPISEQYSEFDKMKKTGVPMPLGDKPIISRMADRHLTLSWRPSIPHGPRFPVTYQVEMCEMPDGDWFTARTGLRSCVCDIRNLEPFRDYKFRIRVENKYGVSEPSPYAITHRSRLEPEPPKFVPYLEPGIDFRPETSPYFPKDFDIERPPHDGYAQAPQFLRQEHDSQYGIKGHNANLFWFVYGYPKPKMTYLFNDEPIEIGGRYDWSYTRNGQATLFINKMLERDVGWYEAVATNEHGQARQRVRLELAEYPRFITRPEETVALQRRTARIEARVTGVPFPDIKWYKDWQPLAPSSRIKMQFIEPDTVILVIHDVILKDEGLYSISARNVAGSVSSSAMLHVEESEHEYSTRIREHPPRVKPSTKPFGDFYDIGDELGRGVQGVVYHAAERLTGRNYAAKIMHGHSALKPFMKNELDILNLLNDRHLIRLYDAYEHEHTLALVLELAAGGELVRDRLLRSQGYTEREIAGYIRQLLRGLKYMHDNNVAHLGLTIGELLLSHAGSDELKLCDFGLSRRISQNKLASLDYGMPEYVAPELAGGHGVSFPADMWSVGIITYILLSGHSPFRGHHDRETLTRVQEGKWEWHDEEWWSRMSRESRDFISRLLVLDWRERMHVDAALAHPWLTFADKIYHDEYIISTDRLRNYYNLYRDWTSNAQCRTWFRRRPLSGAFDHPSKMVYPPGEIYTPEGSPERDRSPHGRPAPDLSMPHWEHPDWEVSAKSESHYQNGPDTYLLQLRDVQFPVRLREYMKVACLRSPAYNIGLHDSYDPRTPIIHERRRFTDIMDEEIDDERRERINNYGSESYTIRRLRHELGTRLDSYAEAQALMESKKDGQLPFFREKPQILPIREGEPAQLSCYAVGDPKPTIQWFKNDMVIAEGQRIKIIEDDDGRSTLKLDPAMHHDVGFYKVVARNKVGQTVARTRIVEATHPDAPDSPTAADVSDTEVLLRWKQPKYDGNSPVVCYSLQYKAGDSVDWKTVAENIDHEFFVVRDLQPDTSYQFRLSSRNRIGWSEKGIPTNLVKTKQAGAPKIEVTKAMKHLQQLTESGQEIVLEEEKPKLDYSIENNPLDWCPGESFTERYSFISELWRGKFSIVVKGIDKTNDSVVVAKILECRPETEVQVQREFECLRRLRHERISNLLGAYQTPGTPYASLILEKLQGADILTYLSSRHDYTEQMVATIVIQILDALQYLHWRGYCHLDLQPDNVVLSSVRAIQVKLIDFGSAFRVTKLGTSVPQVGELEYKAPEVINDEPAYPQTDIWSLGVLTYIMLSGVSPFRGADDAETKQNISFVRYRFEHLYKEITQEATRFLMFVFKKVPLKRPSAEECHEHRWLAQSDFIHKKRERAVFLGNRLKEFSEEYHEKKAREASQADTVATAFGQIAARHLTRSNSIQEELLTNFSSQ